MFFHSTKPQGRSTRALVPPAPEQLLPNLTLLRRPEGEELSVSQALNSVQFTNSASLAPRGDLLTNGRWLGPNAGSDSLKLRGGQKISISNPQ